MSDGRPSPVETERLLELVRAGNHAAFHDLLALHRTPLCRMVAIRLDPRLRARVDPSDIVQEAQLEASRRITGYVQAPALPFHLWLRQLTQDRLVMTHRHHLGAAGRAVSREVALDGESASRFADQLAASGSSPSQRLNRQELAGLVCRALGQLAEQDREVLLMRTFEGLAFSDIAHLLAIGPAAARKRHGRALLRLHQLLSEGGLTESRL